MPARDISKKQPTELRFLKARPRDRGVSNPVLRKLKFSVGQVHEH
jgi:hypothetical protein